jgi:RNA polymerase sigma-70 factor (ECF subfamily)
MIDAQINVVPIMTQAKGRPDAARAEAFGRLVDRAALDRAYRYATLVLGSRSDAEDATHDAVLAAWRRFGDLRERDRFDAWFGRILVNACRDLLRARRRTPLSLGGDSPSGGAATVRNPRVAPDQADAIVTHDALATALRSLSPEHREVVVLRFYFDLTVDQIAVRTGARAGTVKSRLHHALRRLRVAVDRTSEGNVNR